LKQTDPGRFCHPRSCLWLAIRRIHHPSHPPIHPSISSSPPLPSTTTTTNEEPAIPATPRQTWPAPIARRKESDSAHARRNAKFHPSSAFF
jgi:hypothetical protein